MTSTPQPSNDPTEWPTVRTTTPAAARLADLMAVWEDLQFVVNCCQRLDATAGDAVAQHAYWSAALVAYARCWETGVRTSLDPSMLEQLDPRRRSLHKLAMDLRNKHVAHSVNSFEEVAVGLIRAPAGHPHAGEVAGVAAIRGNATLDAEGTKRLAALAIQLLEQLRQRRAELQDEILVEGRKLTMAELDAMPRLSVRSPDHSASGASRQRTR